MMILGKFLSHFLGNIEEETMTPDSNIERENGEDLLEYDDGEWIIIKILENQALAPTGMEPLENLLIEHPSMSVYQMMSPGIEKEDLTSEEEEEEGQEEEEDSPKPVAFKRHLLWRLAGWASPMPCSTTLFAAQSTKAQMDRRKFSRGVLQRQNLAKIRFSPSDRRYGFFKQPCQRLYNY